MKTIKVQSYKLYNNQYIIALTQITNTVIFAFIAILVFKLLSHKVLLIKRKDNRNWKIANFAGKLLQRHKELGYKFFRIFLIHVSDHLSVLFQFE